MNAIIFDLGIFAVSVLAGIYGARLFPKYRAGTTVVVTYNDAYPIRCEYLRRSSIGFHKARVLSGDDLGWSGRVITARTKELRRAA